MKLFGGQILGLPGKIQNLAANSWRPKSEEQVKCEIQCYTYSENIEKCKSLRLFGETNFAIIANRDVDNFVYFWQFFRLSIHI